MSKTVPARSSDAADPSGPISARVQSRIQLDSGRAPDRVASSSLPENAVARRLVQALVARGVDTFFGIPGGPICAVFEAIRLHPKARLIASRHETSAAFAAATYHRVTGKTPVVVVTSGPGITNAVTGIASAHFEGAPMLVLAGDAAWATHGGRLAQDSGPEGLDAEQILSSITRARVRVASPQAAVSQTLAALDIATDPACPGPALVVLAIDHARLFQHG
jgi:acetolactate synthase-1/2/3 large subunit